MRVGNAMTGTHTLVILPTSGFIAGNSGCFVQGRGWLELVKPMHQKPVIKNVMCRYDFEVDSNKCLDLFSAYKELSGELKVKFYPESEAKNLYVKFGGFSFNVSSKGKVVVLGISSIERVGELQSVLDFFWEKHLKKFEVRK